MMTLQQNTNKSQTIPRVYFISFALSKNFQIFSNRIMQFIFHFFHLHILWFNHVVSGIIHFFALLTCIPQYGGTTTCELSNQFLAIWIISNWPLLCIMLLWISAHTSFLQTCLYLGQILTNGFAWSYDKCILNLRKLLSKVDIFISPHLFQYFILYVFLIMGNLGDRN